MILGITLVMIIASLGRAGAGQIVRGICGFALQEVGECPQCKLVAEERAEERGEAQEALFREVEEILEQVEDCAGAVG